MAQFDTTLWALLIVAGYKVASLLVGLGFGYMGYHLFIAGIGGHAGELAAASGVHNLKLSRAAPGTFFALFGAAVIAATIYKGFDVEMPGAVHAITRMLPEAPPVPESGGASG